MNSLLEQLHDIEGLDAIHMWPLGWGWWLLLFCVSVLIGGGMWWAVRRLAYQRSWQKDALEKLAILEKNLSEENARETVIQLSEYLRRIIIKQFPRTECAGLIGKQWLTWLSQHDPKQFNWEEEGAVFLHIPYAPSSYIPSTKNIQELIHAVKYWVR